MSANPALLLLVTALWFGAGSLLCMGVVDAEEPDDDVRLDSDGDGLADADGDGTDDGTADRHRPGPQWAARFSRTDGVRHGSRFKGRLR